MSKYNDNDNNSLIYMLAGVGLGAIIGAAAGLLFAPKAGDDLRGDIGNKFSELKGKTDEWVNEQKARRSVHNTIERAQDELGV